MFFKWFFSSVLTNLQKEVNYVLKTLLSAFNHTQNVLVEL